MDELLQGKKRLHFFQNEKVVNDAISFFEEVFPNENLYVVLSKDGTAPLVKKQKNVLFLSYQSPILKWLLNNCDNFHEIICHSLWTKLDQLICKLHHSNITWVIWGADLFEGLLYQRGYKLYFNEDVLYKIRAQRLPVPLYKFLVKIRDTIHYHYRLRALRRVNNICVTASKDFELLNKYIPLKKVYTKKELFYYPIEKMLDNHILNKSVSGFDIWVNNAAGYNGNHLEIFNRISEFKRKELVHVPLSYGITKYADYIESAGKSFLGDYFDPMMTFIPKENYYNKFLSCNSFIMGHLRGCATGNVVVALYLGAKVFLFKQNVLYDFFKNLGVKLFSIEEDLTEENVYTPLSEDLRNRNRTILIEHFSYKNLLSVIKTNF